MTGPEVTKKELESTAGKGENPGVTLEDVLTKLLITLLTTVINKVFTTLTTDGGIRKLLGGKAPE